MHQNGKGQRDCKCNKTDDDCECDGHEHSSANATRGRRSATQKYVKLQIYPIDHSGDDEPLLKLPITVRKRVRKKGIASNEYLCQFKSDENRALVALVVRDFGEGSFPAAGFSMKQEQLVKGDDESWVWQHMTHGKTASCLSHVYDFVFESEGEGVDEEVDEDDEEDGED